MKERIGKARMRGKRKTRRSEIDSISESKWCRYYRSICFATFLWMHTPNAVCPYAAVLRSSCFVRQYSYSLHLPLNRYHVNSTTNSSCLSSIFPFTACMPSTAVILRYTSRAIMYYSGQMEVLFTGTADRDLNCPILQLKLLSVTY